MSTLHEKLSAVGEVAPERPSWIDESQGPDGDEGVRRYAIALESLAARLAERLAAELKRCERCKGRGWFRGGHAETDFEVTCNDCKGSGRARA